MLKIDEQILAFALKPYAVKSSRYLVDANSSSFQQHPFHAEGNFVISSSSYIENTGHFNAAEFIICTNQLLAASLAHCLFLKHGDDGLKTFSNSYNACLITETSQMFRKIIDPKCFRGIVKINKTRSHGEYVFSDIDISYGDAERDNKASGRVRVAVPKLIFFLV